MATALELINRAMRLCGILDAREAADGADALDALNVLNAMLAEWHEAQIGLPEYAFANLTDPLSSDAADSDAIAYQLALRLAPEYGLEPSARVERTAEEAMSRLRLRYFQPGTVDYSELPGIYRYGCAADFESGV